MYHRVALCALCFVACAAGGWTQCADGSGMTSVRLNNGFRYDVCMTLMHVQVPWRSTHDEPWHAAEDKVVFAVSEPVPIPTKPPTPAEEASELAGQFVFDVVLSLFIIFLCAMLCIACCRQCDVAVARAQHTQEAQRLEAAAEAARSEDAVVVDEPQDGVPGAGDAIDAFSATGAATGATPGEASGAPREHVDVEGEWRAMRIRPSVSH